MSHRRVKNIDFDDDDIDDYEEDDYGEEGVTLDGTNPSTEPPADPVYDRT